MSNYNCLDLNVIKNKIAEFASISEAKDYILNEEVVFNPLIIKQNALETKEAMKVINDNINIQFSGIENINEVLTKADKQIILSGIELKDALVFHNHCERIKKIINSVEGELKIKDYSDSIILRNDVFDEINNCIDNTGEVKDDATTLLKEINKQIDNMSKSLYSKAEQFINSHASSLQESQIYIRENRITFLIKNSDKNKYSGYTYGSSASGLASYVEPGSFIESNNKMIKLIADKNDEISRILNKLTYLLSTVSDDYRRNFESVLKLNVIFSKANYGIKYNCIVPNFIDGNYFEFNDLCHPLIEQNKVVSNSYRIYSPYRGIVISGSNTGGKTVSLKAIGLSIIMSYLGIPIIASSASIPFYKNIFVDIDDNQSIEDSLSTFSAHITNINNILNNSDDKCLILIDELISGTDPKEAQAISLAILDKIKELNSIFVITTHFDDIKNYSYDDENIMLSSVGFNMETLKPTYKYHENSIGSSNALDIASRYFDDNRIIDNAKKYILKNQTKQDELLNKLSKELDNINNEKEKLDNEIIKYNNLNNEFEKRISSFEEEKISIKSKYINELNEYLEGIKEKAVEKLDGIKSKDNSLIKEIDELIVAEKKEDINFNIGDNVRINENEQIGTIVELQDNKAVISIKGLTVKANIETLTLMPKTIKKEKYVERKRMNNVSKELNLVGQRVEDGLIMMEEYLDKANGAHLKSVKVIHGIGSGALRNALRQRMRKLSYVKEFRDGDFYDGGSAVTIVEFK